jgi:hypothetical protein
MNEPTDRPVDLVLAKSLMWAALATADARHKQWYLEQIGRALGIDMDQQRREQDELVKRNDPDALRWEPGVAP